VHKSLIARCAEGAVFSRNSRNVIGSSFELTVLPDIPHPTNFTVQTTVQPLTMHGRCTVRARSTCTVAARSDARLFGKIISHLARPCNHRATTVHYFPHSPCSILSPLRGEMHEGDSSGISTVVKNRRAGKTDSSCPPARPGQDSRKLPIKLFRAAHR
jgi:hypothetical protein